MLKKRLIALMVAGVVTTTALTGCETGNETKSVKDNFIEGAGFNGYIIIEQNDKDILHKGIGYMDADGPTNAFVFDCGEEFYSNAEYSAYYEEPKAERYDEKCEDCFKLGQ